ncbi:XrtV sorting system accessory protein [uncultured Croceicoccus sp.]|uniref:XrtV sorting system accessory protein n=1 Tax=uncultured Croceicoccus sp. TaxID=1295329 RepID=UPI00344F2E6F
METVYDWLTVVLFAFLVVLFLHRSVDVENPKDHLWQYLVAGVGCAVTNWLGNEGMDAMAVGTFLATLAFIYYTLRPFSFQSGGK